MQNKSYFQSKVREFHLKIQEVTNSSKTYPKKPTRPSEKDIALRCSLMLEELLETIHSFGITLKYKNDEINKVSDLSFSHDKDFNMVDVADGLMDLQYVLSGTCEELGLTDIPLFDEVHSANMRKFSSGGYLNKDGKWIKPPDFIGPNLTPIINNSQPVLFDENFILDTEAS